MPFYSYTCTCGATRTLQRAVVDRDSPLLCYHGDRAFEEGGTPSRMRRAVFVERPEEGRADVVRIVVQRGLDAGDSIAAIAQAITDSAAFSPERAFRLRARIAAAETLIECTENPFSLSSLRARLAEMRAELAELADT